MKECLVKVVASIVILFIALSTIFNQSLCGGGLGENLLGNSCDGMESRFLGYDKWISIYREIYGIYGLMVILFILLLVYFVLRFRGYFK